MLSRIKNWLFPPRVDTPAALEILLNTEASRLAQRATTGFCHAKAGSNAELLYKEDVFLNALETCRWNAFALVLADLSMIAEGYLRPESQIDKEKLWGWLEAAYARIVASQQCAYDFAPHKSAFSERLGHARLAAPGPAVEQVTATCRIVYDSLPIHERLRGDDLEVVTGLLRFGAAGFRENLERRCDPRSIINKI